MGKLELDQLREQNPNLRNKMTEKDYNPEQRNAKAMNKQMKVSKKVAEAPKQEQKVEKAEDVEKKEIAEKPKEESKKVETPNEKPVAGEEKKENIEKQKEEKKVEKPKVKRTEAIVNSYSLPISMKHSVAVCKFIKNKKIESATADLQQVVVKKKAVPMKGEIPHRKGKIMSGRFPKKAAEHFIKLLKTLTANANVNELNNPIISEAIANLAQRPRGKAGRVKRKRTHVKIVAREKINKKEKKK